MARALCLAAVLFSACVPPAAPSVARDAEVTPDAPSVERDASLVDVGSAAADAGTGLSDALAEDAAVGDASAPDAAETPRPERYSGHALSSPISPYVAARLRDIAARVPGRDEDVFMKVGASGTVSTNLLYCFAGPAQPRYRLELSGREELLEVIERFRRGRAGSTTPFDRATLAARSGQSAIWALRGSPSPFEQEVAAVNPRYALINYGTNDMGLGTTPERALGPFYESLSALVDRSIELGIIPILTGLNPRADDATSARWVATYDAVTRGIAEARQVPYISLDLASRDLPGAGLLSDGVHGNVYSDGSGAQPCVFTPEALAYNYNVRNLLTIDALDRVVAALAPGGVAPDASLAWTRGEGTELEPYEIDELPFAHASDTSSSRESRLDRYPTCDRGQDESGPERYYRLHLQAQTRLRIIVLDEGDVDVDVHLLQGADCLARGDRVIEGRFEAGEYRISIDTFVSTTPRAGKYLLALVACDADDPACD